MTVTQARTRSMIMTRITVLIRVMIRGLQYSKARGWEMMYCNREGGRMDGERESGRERDRQVNSNKVQAQLLTIGQACRRPGPRQRLEGQQSCW